MSEEHIHRLKQPELSPPPESLVPKQKAVETTPETEKKESKESVDRPHSATYFSVPEWAELLSNPTIDVYGMKDKVVYIEANLMDKMAKGGFKKDSESFNKILGDIETYLRIDKIVEEPFTRVTKVYNMLKTIERAKEVEEERKKRLEFLFL